MIPAFSERALILAPHGRDATIAAGMLRETGIDTVACTDVASLIRGLRQGAGFAVITEEALLSPDLRELSAWLDEQAEWSDFPFVLLTVRGGGLERNPAAGRYLETLGNVTFLERPFHPTTLVSLARAAIRGRRRQYEARARLLALRESETRYRTLFDTMDEGFCVIRFLDGPHGKLSDYLHIEANAAYERHAGIANVVGQYVRQMVPDEADGWVELYRQVLLTGEPIRFERELEATARHLELAAFRIEPASRREVAVIFQDVTNRRRAEIALRDLNATLERRVEDAVAEREAATVQLREAQKLETLGQLTGGLAHDMNNLLSPIMSTLDMLERRYGGSDAGTARALDRAIRSAERAKTLVSRMLGFARRQTLETTAVDLARLMDGMHELIASSVGATIGIETRIAPSLPAVLADANQLELAILNLCINAKDAMPGGGRVTVEAALAPAPPPTLAPAPGGYVLLQVSDTGWGMDEATLAKAIEPFFSTKEIGKGTGLGLSMVHGFANQSGGAFILNSRVGEGTRAELYLPVASTPAAAVTVPHPPQTPAAAGRTVLLVDDEILVRMGTADMLEDLGHTVIEASNGADALELLAANPQIEAVVTDFTMPKMTGAQLAKLIRQEHGELPILLVTGYAAGDLDLALPQLTKPFRQTDLAEALAGLWSVGAIDA
ncbi:response regulator [Novosphingobium sp. Gsoil 351]|uniref:response regulator n=1 Tax=Novosphingobium sp. Gsoil 351 TaxID=2675225 RepID=UPI0012B483D0|nr:response regulator [Novosphingobium sp. Gsoil 351]QGN54739.1 response regulator [Novosphingobium sp. Gsoil 351]